MTDPNMYPPGLDAEKVRKILDHYENQSDEDAAAEIEAAYDEVATIIEVPNELVPKELVPKVRELIAEYEKAAASK